MSVQDYEEVEKIVKSVNKISTKWNIAKIVVFISGIFFLGSVKGDWYGWRNDVDKDRVEFRNHINGGSQTREQNEKRAEKNANIPIK